VQDQVLPLVLVMVQQYLIWNLLAVWIRMLLAELVVLRLVDYSSSCAPVDD
jgi:hypothetical protein